MKKVSIMFLLIMVLVLSFSCYSQAKGTKISGIAEFQTVDVGGPWFGGQLNTSTSVKIPGKHFQPESISLTYINKQEGYEGWQLRGSLVYRMNKNFYSGYGLGVAQLESVNLIVGTVKTGIEIPILSFINLRGEMIGYVPIWNMKDSNERNSVFYGVNMGIGLNF